MKKSGKSVEYYDNGEIRYTGQLKNGKMHGAWRFYRREGGVVKETDFGAKLKARK